MNPISNPNAANQLDPFLLPVPSVNPYLENPNQNFSPYPFVDYVPSPLPPLVPTYTSSSTYGGDTSHGFAAFPYPVHDGPLGAVKREDVNNMGIGVGIGLNLGQRTYFNTTRGLFGFGAYGSGPNMNPPRCQVDGCKTDLTGAKHYHRRHKVCEFHSKAPIVIVGGLQERFCQQCSRFHVVAEFDEAKRSCRKRLADHNRRRRKPQFPSNKDTADQGSHKLKSNSSTSSAHNKPTNDTSYGLNQCNKTSAAVTNDSTTSMSSTSCNLEGSHAAADRLQTIDRLNNGTTTLSLGEVAKLDSAFSNQSLDIYHEPSCQAAPFALAAARINQEKQQSYYHQQQQQQQNTNTFGSSSSSNKGQALFQVDFM